MREAAVRAEAAQEVAALAAAVLAEAARAEAVRTHLIQIGTRLRLTIAAEESRVLEKRLRRHDGRRASRPQASLHIVERRDAAIRDDRYADGVDLSK